MFLTIMTSTYNRANLLENLYSSLINQTNKDFVWLIIDDGSVDNTKEIVEKLKNENKINIEYLYKKNGGKHTALNIGFENLKTDLTVIVDSDDKITSDAVNVIYKYYQKYINEKNISGFCFLKGYDENKSVTVKYPDDEIKTNYNEYIINAGITGDKCEVFKSDILRKYKFDEYENEKFLAEGYLWSLINDKLDMVFINRIIYLCEYLEDGLTKSGRKLRLNNPLGGKRHAEEYLKKKYKFKIRFKNALLYNVYSIQSKTKIDFSLSRFLLLITYIPALVLKIYWNKKYMK